jgi:hypothetical protein
LGLLLGLWPLAACSDSPSTTPIDSAVVRMDAYDTARCLIKGDFGAVGALTGVAGNTGGVTMTATLEAGPPRDTFFVKMVTGKGVFSGGVAPGTYTIAGVDANYLNCGLCVHIIADIVTGQGPSKFYFADSGTMTLTSTTAPIAGSGQDLHLREVDINTGAFVTGGCEASIGSVTFTTP